MDVREMIVPAAQGYRDFWEKHPVAAIGLGFVPLLGTALGALDAAAAYADPNASTVERGLASLGLVPGGQVAKKGQVLKELVIGPAAQDRLKAAGKGKALIPGSKRIAGVPLVEIEDKLSDLRLPTNASMETTLGELVPKWDELYEAYPELKNFPVKIGREDKRVLGGYNPPVDPGDGMIRPGSIELNYEVGGEVPLASMTDFRDTLSHEIQHAAQFLDNLDRRHMLGANAREVGWLRYLDNTGEVMARVTQSRRNWPRPLREHIPYSDHVRAERVRQYMGLADEGNPFDVDNIMKDPLAVEDILNRTKELGDDGVKALQTKWYDAADSGWEPKSKRTPGIQSLLDE